MGPVIVTALFGPGDDGWIQSLRREHYPPALDRVPAHLTLFHHLPPAAGREIASRLAALAAGPAPEAWIEGIMDLGRGTALRVRSDALEEMRASLAEALHGLLVPIDQAPWRPHVTIQNKVEPREARRLQEQLCARLARRPLTLRALASWRYRDGPWEPIRTYPFRG